jgi:hypothetical protein
MKLQLASVWNTAIALSIWLKALFSTKHQQPLNCKLNSITGEMNESGSQKEEVKWEDEIVHNESRKRSKMQIESINEK